MCYVESANSSRSEDSDSILLADSASNEVLLYSDGDVTIFSFVEILNALQTANCESVLGMDRICAVISSVLPRALNLPRLQWHQLRRALLKTLPRVRRIHVCSQDCVRFINQYKDCRYCPKCNRPRYYQDKSHRLLPVNVFRTIPLATQIRIMFSRAATARALRMSCSICAGANDEDKKICDITESVGFKEVVFDSGFMTDLRNVVLILGTDGVNPFARERVSTYSVWPFVFFCANLPRDQRYKVCNMILGGLVSGHVYVDGLKKNRTVKNLSLYVDYFAREVRELGESKVNIIDASYPVGSPRRIFFLSAMLLGTIADYDAHCHTLCIVPAGSVRCCIKCNIEGVWYASVGVRAFGQSRRFLEPDDNCRHDRIHGLTELRAAPAVRTREQSIDRGKRVENIKDAVGRKERGAKAALFRNTQRHGVTGLCALTTLPGYDPYDRAFIDYMHLIKNVAWAHLLKRMLGLGKKAAVPKNDVQVWSEDKKLSSSSSALRAQETKYNARQQVVEVLRIARTHIMEHDSFWEIPNACKEVAAERMKRLVCPASFYTHRKNLFEFTGSWDTIEWHHFVERYVAPLFSRLRVMFEEYLTQTFN
jgi:hypothetical protein